MMIEIAIERRCLQLTDSLSALASLASSRSETKDQFLREMAGNITDYTPLSPLPIDSNTLRTMITQVSEQIVYRPLEELRHFYFTYARGAFLLPGYPRLYYMATNKQQLSPSKSAIAAIGEGVAAILTQRLYPGTLRLARPYHTYPDLVSTDQTFTLMTEAKATVDSVQGIKQVIQAEVFRMAQHVSACTTLDVRPVVGLLIGTALLDETKYHAVITEVRK
ncbi:hypothetical protein [Pantanalinema sp. GBBB05]|uniref:hypothetical protein n=1 Tax=Pantanalinema sp. GBBB05 TaxID=2604139 RepID=UPI001DEC31BE|nr:hypothetical protein [Pantanalinema sp. GBBB05]